MVQLSLYSFDALLSSIIHLHNFHLRSSHLVKLYVKFYLQSKIFDFFSTFPMPNRYSQGHSNFKRVACHFSLKYSHLEYFRVFTCFKWGQNSHMTSLCVGWWGNTETIYPAPEIKWSELKHIQTCFHMILWWLSDFYTFYFVWIHTYGVTGVLLVISKFIPPFDWPNNMHPENHNYVPNFTHALVGGRILSPHPVFCK